MKQVENSYCGFIAIIGRPNVGKSTLLNYILGGKYTITSRKPQTTRHRLLGIKTIANRQAIYVDTPGLHRSGKKVLNRALNRTAWNALKDIDVVIFMIEAGRWLDEDDWILQRLAKVTCPVILVINKIDRLDDRTQLLPFLDEYQHKMTFQALVPISAEKGDKVDKLQEIIMSLLPESPHYFADDQIVDRDDKFLTAEFIREKLFRSLGQELPYACVVQIEQFQHEENLLRIAAVIWVERQSQKAIVIGKQGERLKRVGTQARMDLQRLFGKKIFLQLWVKVREGWSDDKRSLTEFGLND